MRSGANQAHLPARLRPAARSQPARRAHEGTLTSVILEPGVDSTHLHTEEPTVRHSWGMAHPTSETPHPSLVPEGCREPKTANSSEAVAPSWLRQGMAGDVGALGWWGDVSSPGGAGLCFPPASAAPSRCGEGASVGVASLSADFEFLGDQRAHGSHGMQGGETRSRWERVGLQPPVSAKQQGVRPKVAAFPEPLLVPVQGCSWTLPSVLKWEEKSAWRAGGAVRWGPHPSPSAQAQRG